MTDNFRPAVNAASTSATSSRGTLNATEAHPAAYGAREYLMGIASDLPRWQEAFASCALSGDNRLAEICSETLGRLLNGEPVSDRYLLGLAWTIRFSKEANQ